MRRAQQLLRPAAGTALRRSGERTRVGGPSPARTPSGAHRFARLSRLPPKRPCFPQPNFGEGFVSYLFTFSLESGRRTVKGSWKFLRCNGEARGGGGGGEEGWQGPEERVSLHNFPPFSRSAPLLRAFPRGSEEVSLSASRRSAPGRSRAHPRGVSGAGAAGAPRGLPHLTPRRRLLRESDGNGEGRGKRKP